MKTMTCKELGGPCDQPLSARSWDDMVRPPYSNAYRREPSGNCEEDGKNAHRRSHKMGPGDEA